MRTIINRIRRSLAIRGVAGTIAICAGELMNNFDLASCRIETSRQKSDNAFDNRWNVDTGGIYRPDESEVCGENWAHGVRYQAVDAGVLDGTLRGLDINYGEFTFLDLGSGKGRALLVAAEFGFKKIIGVEYCPDLNRIAAQNLKRHPVATRRGGDLELVTADAAQFVLPDAPLVMYMFNPFSRSVMARVVANVTASIQKSPRRLIVIYFTPYDADLWDRTGFFKRLHSSPAIYDTGPVM